MHTFLRSVNVADTLLSPSSFESAWAEWLSVDIHRHFSFDYLSNTGQGPWYAFNDNSLFKAMDIGTRFLGPKAVLQKRLGPRSVLEWMSFTATYWQRLVGTNMSGLADYGSASNLLECVPSYIHGVPALNAYNVFMMRTVAALVNSTGPEPNTTLAAELGRKAARLAAAVLQLYQSPGGYWACAMPDGSKQPVRHVRTPQL